MKIIHLILLLVNCFHLSYPATTTNKQHIQTIKAINTHNGFSNSEYGIIFSSFLWGDYRGGYFLAKSSSRFFCFSSISCISSSVGVSAMN